jgi:hypothetical protein
MKSLPAGDAENRVAEKSLKRNDLLGLFYLIPIPLGNAAT